MVFADLLLIAGLTTAPSTLAQGGDENLDMSLNRCALLGYEKDTEGWRNCVLEQLKNLSDRSDLKRIPHSPDESSTLGLDAPPKAQGSERITRPAQIKREVSKRDRRRCAKDYEGPDRIFEIDLEVGVDGRAEIIGWPVGTATEVQDSVRCIVEKTQFEPALIDSIPVAARARLSVSLGWAGSSGKLPNMVPPKFLGFDPDQESRCYPPAYVSSRAQPIIVEVLVSKGGVLEEAKVVKSDSHDFVARTAECVALAAKFEVGKVNGRPKAMRTNLTVSVKLP